MEVVGGGRAGTGAGIYLIRAPEGRTYVGKARNLNRRRNGHFYATKGPYYRDDEATFEVLERYTPLPNPTVLGEPLFTYWDVENRLQGRLAEREAHWIDALQPTDNKQRPRP